MTVFFMTVFFAEKCQHPGTFPQSDRGTRSYSQEPNKGLMDPRPSNIVRAIPMLWQQDLDCPLFEFLINENDLDSAQF